MMRHALCLCAALAAACCPLPAADAPAPYGPVPTEHQVRWQRLEWYAFMHFGINTYTGREWGYGNEDITLFNPTAFNADKVVKTLKKAGMPGFIYTAKHHDGWCAWPTKTTKHNISATPYKRGRGDLVREWASAAKKNGMLFGVYLSPWDRNAASYGKPEYQEMYMAQIRELLTNYGPIFEIWFDGAMGGDGWYGGAKEKRDIGNATTYYRYPEVVRMIRELQPRTIIWGASQYGDVHWGGSEKGHVPYPCHNVYRREDGTMVWNPLEGDTTINRAGWFWHEGQAPKTKSPAHLMQVYLDSVGRGANLILNIAPNKKGELDPTDVKALMQLGEARRKLLAKDRARGASAQASEVRGNDPQFGADKVTDGDIESYWCPNDGTTTGTLEITLRKPATFDIVRLREQIRLGQRVRRFEIDVWQDGAWKTLDAGGKSIGNQVMRRLPAPVTADRVRVRITEADACPCISELSLLRMPEIPAWEVDARPTLSRAKWKSEAARALDGKPKTQWEGKKTPDSFTIDLGQEERFSAFSYTPRQDGKTAGMTDRYRLSVSADGKQWREVAQGEFGNLRANPVEQSVRLSEPVRARYVRFTAERCLDAGAPTVAEFNLHP